MRAPISALGIILLTACSSTSSLLQSQVAPGRLVVVGIEGEQVVVRNLGAGPLELRRRAPTGEIVGVSVLDPGGSSRMAATSRRAVEICNVGAAPVRYMVEATAAPNGRARALILSHRQL